MSRRAFLFVLALVPACAMPRPESHVPPGMSTWIPAPNDSIVVAGRRFHVGAPVVLWTESPYYDAYSTKPRFSDAAEPDGLRYQPGRVRRVTSENPDYVPLPAAEQTPADFVDERTELQKQRSLVVSEEVLVEPVSPDLEALRAVVDQFVLHYDVCGVSQSCFRVLHDERELSVQFLLDVDGTIYQTLDARETAWHATKSNPRSIGIEIANIGAYPLGVAKALDTWYAHDGGGVYVRVPARLEGGGVRTAGFVGRPARLERVVGEIQGDVLQQYDFTREQYESLVKLTAALCRAFPQIEPDAPRDEEGRVKDRALSDAEWREFRGILGHYHVQTNKADPGPAFDWERYLAAVRERLAALPVSP